MGLFGRWSHNRPTSSESWTVKASSTSSSISRWVESFGMKWEPKQETLQRSLPSFSTKTSTVGWELTLRFSNWHTLFRVDMVCLLSLHRATKCFGRRWKQTQWNSSSSWHEEYRVSSSSFNPTPLALFPLHPFHWQGPRSFNAIKKNAKNLRRHTFPQLHHSNPNQT